MTIDEILAGESSNVEFKESLPAKSIKYMKSVVAFANGEGGKIIIGVEDGSRNVVGVDKNEAFTLMDSIANAISDSCQPAIIPDIYMQSIEDKTIIIVDIAAGRQRPYYLISEGMEHGVYVRVAGTTRHADAPMIKELLFEGNNRFFDKTVCMGLSIDIQDIKQLCDKLKQAALRNSRSEEDRTLVKDVTAKQLLSWGVLTEKNGVLLPTNAYAILTGSDILHCTFQCAVFKDNERVVFVDRREFSGPVQDIIEDAYNFVLRNIHLGAEFEGLYRQDIYEIPPAAIRELIINAAVHRSYLDNGNIQVAIFDNRLEITSPGKLPLGQTIAKMREGYSKVRNEALAMAFTYMHLVERWGTGMPRIAKMIKEAGLGELEILGGETELRFNIYRRQSKEVIFDTEQATAQAGIITEQATAQADVITEQDTVQADSELSTEEKILLAVIKKRPQITINNISQVLNWTRSKTVYHLNRLREKKLLERVGSSQKGYWKIL